MKGQALNTNASLSACDVLFAYYEVIEIWKQNIIL